MLLTKPKVHRNLLSVTFSFMELLYHSIVRDVRKKSGNATLGLLLVVAQNLAMLAIFFVMFSVLGLRGMAIRGDFVLYLLSGIFLFIMHNTAVNTVAGSARPTDPMMMHAPMNTFLAILTTAFTQLYLQVLSLIIILFGLHVIRGGIEIHDPIGALLPFLYAWGSGVAVGLLFLVARPFAPKLVQMLSLVYRRANLITSGKMMPANYMGASMVSWFDWNPLFHAIDQARGAVFVNYFPRNSNMDYPLHFILAATLIALLVEYWLRRHMSASWGKRSML